MIKNTAGQRIGAQLVSATDGSAFTGAVTVAVTVDAGTQATGSVGAGACTHEGGGYHTYAPAQAETNGDLVAFTFTGSGAIPATVQVYTVAGDAFTRLGAPVGASISADLAAVQADTDNLQTRIPAALVSGRIDASVGAMAANVMTAAAAAADLTTELQSGLATAANLATVAGYLDTEIAAILADTNELQTDWVNGGRLDLILDARASQTSVDDLPTNAELATALGTADDATLAAIAALNNLSSAQAQTAAAAALTAYDPPTNAEMEARTLIAANYATAAGVSAVETDTQDIQSRLPAALVSGRMDATVDATGMESGAIDAILDDTIGDGTLTFRQALRVLVAGMAGKLSGAATTTVTIRNLADSADVVVATVDADGNRSAVTVTP
jgi:hypothetical protein